MLGGVHMCPSLLPLGRCRFHILCGYILCEEKDLSVYDPAINQEHLMKCLQSLIEAYRDLRQQVGGHRITDHLHGCTLFMAGVAMVTFDPE